MEYSAFRNPSRASPQVVSVQLFDSLENARTMADSADAKAMIAEMRGLGCTNITLQIFERSPLMPETLRPSGR